MKLKFKYLTLEYGFLVISAELEHHIEGEINGKISPLSSVF